MNNDIRTNSSIVFYITDKGHFLANRIAGCFPSMAVVKFDASLINDLWGENKAFVFIMATGIVVRTIAPLLRDKRTDPGVVVLDEKGEYAISLVGGHLGGANWLAKEIASRLGAEAVITTASDINNLPSLDLWARDCGLIIENWDSLSRTAARLINEETLLVYSELDIHLPEAFTREPDPRHADVLITKKRRIETCGSCVKDQLYLRPRNLIVGIGCNSGTSSQEIESAVKTVLLEHNLSFLSIRSIATIDQKAQEPGLIEFAAKYDFRINSFPADELNKVGGIVKSEAVFRATGAHAVAEPASLLVAGTVKPLVPKQKSGNVTVAIALKKSKQPGTEELKCGSVEVNNTCEGRLYVVGIGPGGGDHITPRAKKAIAESSVIVGYSTYLDLIPDLVADKEIFSTGMTQEIDRCKKAVELALSGKKVSVISGGDPGIYAMAGLVFETLRSEEQRSGSQEVRENRKSCTSALNPSDLVVEVIPGISALNAAAARLGAPLMHDFVSISLSDRLTPWGVIEKRLNSAAMADFVIVIYNPRSKGRAEHFSRAIEIVRRYRKPETPVGIVRAAMRTSEEISISNLDGVLEHEIDMQTTVVIGNSGTFVWNNRMITPRGYEKKLDRR
jgi:cobalt-precorrin 5A hydrolase / precorrin-3B C17-methyltransferase